ncbi:MAG: hypothetical protein GY949_13440 [Gammaproteobacteria bacterium]|nr:hypothetical protein [Gammaproteobacteria bacterium]
MFQRTFSESWYRIADVEASLRPTVKVRKQRFRGSEWYVLQDPFNNSFFRLRPEAWYLVARLEPGRTIEQTWKFCMQEDPDAAPGQEETIRLLTQLHHANLLYYNTPSDSENFFARYKKRKQRELKARLASVLFARIPLVDPDEFVTRIVPYLRVLFGPIGWILWFSVVLLAGKLVLDNVDRVADQAQSVLASENLVLLYLSMVLVKTLHEFGHAIVCRYFGGEVHTMGVMLIVFTPLPYMDATSSWGFRNRWQRAFVGAAGMIVEIFIAALAVFVWAKTGQGVLNSLAYNIMFIASVSTILFNANPLLKFDGYYIFSDMLDVPNLYTRARQQIRYFAERYLLGMRNETSPSSSAKGAVGLCTYAVASATYRVFVFIGILLFVGDQYLILGVLMAVLLVVMWAVVPPYKLVKYLLASAKLEHRRRRAMTVALAVVVAAGFVLGQYPFPDRFRAPGVVLSAEYAQVSNDVAGQLEEMLVDTGANVVAGAALMRLSNPQIDNRRRMMDAQLRHLSVLERRARSAGGEDLAALAKRRESLELKHTRLLEQQASLVVRARQAGIWVAPEVPHLLGAWLQRGEELGTLINPHGFNFSAVVAQDEVSALFGETIHRAEVRLHGRAAEVLTVGNLEIIPFQQERLPSAALGWSGGGPIPVAASDSTGIEAAEPFFRIDAKLSPEDASRLLHGHSGLLRLSFEEKPLLVQWSRAARQVLQRRYQL